MYNSVTAKLTKTAQFDSTPQSQAVSTSEAAMAGLGLQESGVKVKGDDIEEIQIGDVEYSSTDDDKSWTIKSYCVWSIANLKPDCDCQNVCNGSCRINVRSPVLSFIPYCEWVLKLVEKDDGRYDIAVELELVTCHVPEIKVYVEFSLLDEDKNVCNRHIFVENPKVCKEGSCISIEKFIGDSCKSGHSLDSELEGLKTSSGKMIVACSISVEVPPLSTSAASEFLNIHIVPLLDTPVVKFKIGDKEFQVHKRNSHSLV